MPILYDFHLAPSPRRARIFLAEKGIDYECVQIDFASGEQLGDAYKAINPRCAVPAFRTDEGDILTENLAIASYAESLKPHPNLMGKTPLETALVLEWNWRCEFDGLMAVAEILRNSSKRMKDRAMTGPHNFEQIPALAARGAKRLPYFFEDLNAQIAKNGFVASDRFTFADITALVLVDFSAWVKAQPRQDLTAIWDWHEKVSQRPSAKA